MSETADRIYCANHPTVETSLRCNRCEKPICARCAVLTPTGYRCKECIGSQQKTFETARWQDFLLGFAAAAILSFIGSLIVAFLPLAILTILLAPLIGTIIGEVVRRVTQKRRSQKLFIGVILSIILGASPLILIQLASFGLFALAGGGAGLVSSLLPLVWQGIYLFLAVSSAYYRISGIVLRL
jgi:hypothetical protein